MKYSWFSTVICREPRQQWFYLLQKLKVKYATFTPLYMYMHIIDVLSAKPTSQSTHSNSASWTFPKTHQSQRSAYMPGKYKNSSCLSLLLKKLSCHYQLYQNSFIQDFWRLSLMGTHGYAYIHKTTADYPRISHAQNFECVSRTRPCVIKFSSE